MNTPKSLFNLRDFRQRIDSRDEKFLRDWLMDVTKDCPTELVFEIAECVYRCRESELKKPTNN